MGRLINSQSVAKLKPSIIGFHKVNETFSKKRKCQVQATIDLGDKIDVGNAEPSIMQTDLEKSKIINLTNSRMLNEMLLDQSSIHQPE